MGVGQEFSLGLFLGVVGILVGIRIFGSSQIEEFNFIGSLRVEIFWAQVLVDGRGIGDEIDRKRVRKKNLVINSWFQTKGCEFLFVCFFKIIFLWGGVCIMSFIFKQQKILFNFWVFGLFIFIIEGFFGGRIFNF